MDNIQTLINVEFSYLPVINFAMQQNRVSVIRDFSIENLTEEVLKDLKIELTADPEFTTTIPISIEVINAKEKTRVETPKLNLSANYFAQLTERVSGDISLKIYSKEELLFEEKYPINILAYDQWGGIAVLPEMLSAFVTPNHPATIPIIKRAATILEQWTDSPSLDEYQSRNPDRVQKQMAAIYTAIAEQEIIYSTVPASFEDYGQRIRLVDSVMIQKLGTCLDMALLYASCLEAIGIHSLIIVVNGHAFAGGWLVPETFPDSVVEDVSLINKRIADGINDITLVETTCMNMGQNIDFDQAVKIANKRISQPDFILAIDVKRARFSGIKPIPQRILNGQHWEIKEEVTSISDRSQVTPQAINPYDLSGISSEVVVTKQLLWERKLLDLSLRNNLLNIRITKNTLQLISANLDLFEDALADGEEFRIMHKPTDWDNPLFDYGLYKSVSEADPITDLIKSELTQKRLRSYLTENEISKALTYLYRSSRTAMEENGANTLYIALGLLKWYETKSSERPRYAPILLIPVEIIRKSASKGYVIRSREEETMMNITLLEMLRQNFNITIPGLDPLPMDKSGVNVKLIYSIIRNSIKNQPKWDVEEQAILGLFSFNKFIMWNDIHNNSHKLIENNVVSSLMNGKIEWNVEEYEVDAKTLDNTIPPDKIVLPISADSSQLEAIWEASEGRNFILHGPPGTGKSQTITNLIANALYKGKRVLFVAEKMAALSVVQRRLEAIGLAPFCLELHSNKTKKGMILSQLKETTDIVKTTHPENFKQEAERIFALRTEMNKYIEALHKVYPFGISLYDAIVKYQQIDADPLFYIPEVLLCELNKNKLQQWNETLELLISITNACGHPYKHPLTGITIGQYSSTIKDEASKSIQDLIDLISDIRKQLNQLPDLFSEFEVYKDKKNTKIITDIIDKLLNIPELTSSLLASPQLSDTLDEYRDVCEHGKNRDRLKQSLLSGFSEGVLSIDAKKMLFDWNRTLNKWFIPKFFGQRSIKKQLIGYATSQLNNDQVSSTLEDIIEFQSEQIYLKKYENDMPIYFKKFGRNGSEDWKTIEQIITDTSAINSLIQEHTKDISKATNIKRVLSLQLSDGISTFRGMHGGVLITINNLIPKLGQQEQLLYSILGTSEDILYKQSDNWIDSVLKQLNIWYDNLDKLKDWYQWLLVYNKMQALQIGFIANQYKEDNIDTNRLLNVFYKSFYKTVIEYIISEEPNLQLFKGNIFNDTIEKYKRLVADFEQLTRKELVAKLATNLPSFTREAAQNSEVGILQRNIRNNARGISIRRLFDLIPTLLPRMCPCMLMSPISVAQYIDVDADKFDLIVFDEASQMPTYEAVGAIARGKNVVIVGDPKQMPPTNFFSVNSTDEDNIEMEDLESILDDCLALSMPSKYLLWHYRSKHESLIAFSNSEYYDNKLLTFPSPDNIESKVRFVPIDGHYDKGKSRQNRAEAQAIVDEIVRRLKDEKLRKRSIGVVTFSSVQQSLIEDLLSDVFMLNSQLENLALECEEPIFIKNLENVQGDERDVILFSVGYGPDKEGRVSMNFGPLNREGGERRLNVAVSRARYEMIIYSTLRSDQIDLNRTRAVGVAGLKRFLEYAEKGGHIANRTQNAVVEYSINNLIANQLEKLGYKVDTNIGCSGYRIDIGIVDADNPSIYKLGIICDGENYRRAKMVRDREIVQNSVLRMLGWRILKIWTLDWWENPNAVLTSIEEALMAKGTDVDIEIIAPQKNVETKSETIGNISSPTEFVENKISSYRISSLMSSPYGSEEFFYPGHRTTILDQIKEVIETEAPISKPLLCKRILSAWGISRLGQRLDGYLNELLQCSAYYVSYDENLSFYWANEEQYLQYDLFRTGLRDAVDLPPEEVANAMKYILTDEISLPTTDLSKLSAQLLGFARGGSNVDAAMRRGMLKAIDKGYLKVENGRAVIA
ncbi:superfamily I DNA and/or RNA helicase/very-short-patch-repair endonuclease [Dysgonomonas sp. PH5-45]|uniref:DUF3320 domain-containing protein n=1 Tax=unclassified Dysgonomonas TaxID=2630389 RepID=UPI002473CF7F|nr:MULTISPECIES: DUF3320 domain-containing protein [unclassified Dysgonomonas]MDH6355776.1 superfamily I DNA and/or RNA helicase/very-short-patch-repair endonuclease [Dysgonomonas sp. PH5-45]MDH6388663.1 superfamily I DNA and/or RNA helicase/very-short-patch-repair endonuclease [Dysgonomonas sp. PH5-37]